MFEINGCLAKIIQIYLIKAATKTQNLKLPATDEEKWAVRLRRDDTFGAKIQENETSVLFLYYHSKDITAQYYDRLLRAA